MLTEKTAIMNENRQLLTSGFVVKRAKAEKKRKILQKKI